MLESQSKIVLSNAAACGIWEECTKLWVTVWVCVRHGSCLGQHVVLIPDNDGPTSYTNVAAGKSTGTCRSAAIMKKYKPSTTVTSTISRDRIQIVVYSWRKLSEKLILNRWVYSQSLRKLVVHMYPQKCCDSDEIQPVHDHNLNSPLLKSFIWYIQRSNQSCGILLSETSIKLNSQ